ncbi:LysM peptidoglycan-binding domain-containing protein [Chloroflexota bacterium]
MKHAAILVGLIILLASCSNGETIEDTIATQTETKQQPSQNPTKTEADFGVTSTPTFADLILPTSTPFLYSVVLNDTLIGIAFQFNISLEDLLNANPSAGNQPLIVGQELIIPTADEPGTTLTATPFPVQVSQVNCYESKDESLQCLALIMNEYNEWIQNISTQIHLIDTSGKVIESCTAYSLIDLLPPGKSIILSCSFQKVPIIEYHPQSIIISASNVPSPSEQYLDISIRNTLVTVNWEGSSAQVQGEIILNSTGAEASWVKILAIAFNKEGTVVGFRHWESRTILPSGEVMPFELMISSHGSIIDRVELIVEGNR